MPAAFTLELDVSDWTWYQVRLKHKLFQPDKPLLQFFSEEISDYLDGKLCSRLGIQDIDGINDTVACVNLATVDS